MDLANKYNGIVIGTGDMSELALGWATFNGIICQCMPLIHLFLRQW